MLFYKVIHETKILTTCDNGIKNLIDMIAKLDWTIGSKLSGTGINSEKLHSHSKAVHASFRMNKYFVSRNEMNFIRPEFS